MFSFIIFVSVALLTPTYALQLVSTLTDKLGMLGTVIINFISPLMVIIINFTLIPVIINFSIDFEDHLTESSKLNTKIFRIFFFMLLNTLLLPITETSSSLVLAERFKDTDILSWPLFLSTNLMNQQYFYIKLIIQLTFITNGMTLFDGPHRILNWFGQWRHARRQRSEEFKSDYEDSYQFDVGYNQSYVMVIFLNCLLFSTLVPVIPLFAGVYFYIKYQVDKNNLVFVYRHGFESGGQIQSNVLYFMYFNLWLYLVVMASFFGFKFGGNYSWAGPAVIVAWILFYIFFRNKT
jgi:hypothetical protein